MFTLRREGFDLLPAVSAAQPGSLGRAGLELGKPASRYRAVMMPRDICV